MAFGRKPLREQGQQRAPKPIGTSRVFVAGNFARLPQTRGRGGKGGENLLLERDGPRQEISPSFVENLLIAGGLSGSVRFR